MKKKILLVKIEIKGTTNFSVPFGILILAGALMKKGFEVDILHCAAADNLYERIKDKARGVFLVGFSTVTSPTLINALEYSQKLRREGYPIVWGGPHASFMPEETMKEKGIDYILRGEGEESLPLLAERLARGEGVEDIPGIVYRKGLEVIVKDWPSLVQNLDEYSPAWELIDLRKYMFKFPGYKRTAQIMASKGCPHKCTFCFNTVFNKCQIRYYSPDVILGQVRYLKEKYGINGILLNDDNFFANKKVAMDLLEKIDMPWATLARAPMLREGFFTNKVLNNCISLVIGGESGSDSMLKKMKKGITAKQIESAISFCKENNIPIRVSFIMFFPRETDEERMGTVRFIYRLATKYNNDFAWKIYNPYPGTVMYEEALDMGWEKPGTIMEWSNYTRNMRLELLSYLDTGKIKYWEKVFKLVKYGIFFNKTNYNNFFSNAVLGFFRKIINRRWRKVNVKFFVEMFLFDLYLAFKAVRRLKNTVKKAPHAKENKKYTKKNFKNNTDL
jgi:anaerobic magnesium-protoporphyrin IX monomethyl ester cyclase